MKIPLNSFNQSSRYFGSFLFEKQQAQRFHYTLSMNFLGIFVAFFEKTPSLKISLNLSFSTVFHTLGCNSPDTCLFCGRLDYTGIAILITGSFLPWVYYSFYCDSTIQATYIGVILLFGNVLEKIIAYQKLVYLHPF